MGLNPPFAILAFMSKQRVCFEAPETNRELRSQPLRSFRGKSVTEKGAATDKKKPSETEASKGFQVL